MTIEIKDYSKRIGRKWVLQNITLLLAGGHVYGLWGSNGAGKTMLMRAVAGLIRPSSGTVLVDGKTLGREISFPAEMGFTLEHPAFLDSYTGLDNLALLAGIQGKIGREDISKAMRDVGLDPEDKRTYRKYSLGMKQKLAIAAAVMERPKLILLDEPTVSLEEESIPALLDIINVMRAKGALIILSSHDRKFLTAASDIIYQLRDGQITGCVYESTH